jgi:hypothetical protein
LRNKSSGASSESTLEARHHVLVLQGGSALGAYQAGVEFWHQEGKAVFDVARARAREERLSDGSAALSTVWFDCLRKRNDERSPHARASRIIVSNRAAHPTSFPSLPQRTPRRLRSLPPTLKSKRHIWCLLVLPLQQSHARMRHQSGFSTRCRTPAEPT